MSVEEFDLGSAMDAISTTLETPEIETPEAEVPETPETPEVNDRDTITAKPPESVPTVRQPPKSWSRDMHEEWAKLSPKAQEYAELREKQMSEGVEHIKSEATVARQFREIVTPYKPMLAAMGVSETDAVKYLLNAQYRLTQGSEADRLAAWQQMGAELGFMQAEEQAPVDPVVKALQEKLNGIESAQRQTAEREKQVLQTRVNAEIEVFASDPKNVHFNDVSKDMVTFINAGLDLKDAYDRAVWANPLTRAKETARLQTEAQETLKKKSQEESETARRATSVNIRSRDSQREPTEPKGKMFDDMPEMLKDIKARIN